jgi:hypothetical protein
MKKYTTNDIPEGFPFIGTMDEFGILLKTIDNLKEKLINSDNPREIIFESWFIFDYYIRRMLLQGLQIENFENDKLDLMYELLPQSFDSCLKLFENLINNQREIYDKKLHPNTFFKYQENTIGFTGSFIAYMINEKKELFNEFYGEYWNYLKRGEPEYFENYQEWDYDKHKVYKIVNNTWMKHVENLNDEWFKTIRKLNKCRNKAAHLYDEKYIYSAFGISGNESFKHLKIEIINLLKTTLNIDVKF